MEGGGGKGRRERNEDIGIGTTWRYDIVQREI